MWGLGVQAPALPKKKKKTKHNKKQVCKKPL